MAGDAGLSPEEIEFLRGEDGRRKAWTRDYMLFFFWVNILLPVLARFLLGFVLMVDSGVGVYFGFCYC